MNPRERILTALNHQMGDHLTWAPYFRTWWDAHIREGEIPAYLSHVDDYLHAFEPLGLNILDKGAPAVNVSYPGMQVNIETSPAGRIKTTYVTPVGSVYSLHQPTSAYDHTNYKISYEFKSMTDYPVIMYIFEHMQFESNYQEYLDKQASIGDAGQYMSEGPDTPLHHLFVNLMGYERTIYALFDYPHEMEKLIGLMYERCCEALEIVVRSPAPVILTPENTNADFETPRLFARYALPYLQRASERCHTHGKLHVGHMCGKLKPLLPLLATAGLDGIESLTPPPYSDTYLWEARQALPGVCIIGGVSPHLLVGDWSRLQVEEYLHTLFDRMAPGDNFLLAVSDDTPANADLERFLWVSELVEKRGKLPLQSTGI